MTFDLPDLKATEALGRQLGSVLFSGAIVALVGELGAGKTHFTRALAEGLGVPDGRIVTSPTFVLLQEYHGRMPLYHFDAYRLPSALAEEMFLDLGALEHFEADGVSVIEWADRVERALPNDHLRIVLRVTGETKREALLVAYGPRHQAILSQLSQLSQWEQGQQRQQSAELPISP